MSLNLRLKIGQRVGVLVNDGGTTLAPGIVVSYTHIQAGSVGSWKVLTERGLLTVPDWPDYVGPVETARVREWFTDAWIRLEAELAKS